MSDIKRFDSVEETACPPDAARVMEGLRDTGYDFNTAIADIVDRGIGHLARLGEPVNAHMLLLQNVLYRHRLSPAFATYYNGQPV